MSVFPADVRRALDAGDSIAAIRRRLDDAGVRIGVLDPLSQWLPGWERPAGLSDEDFAFFDVDEEQFFTWAEELDVDSLTVIEPYGRAVPVELGVGRSPRCATAPPGPGCGCIWSSSRSLASATSPPPGRSSAAPTDRTAGW